MSKDNQTSSAAESGTPTTSTTDDDDATSTPELEDNEISALDSDFEASLDGDTPEDATPDADDPGSEDGSEAVSAVEATPPEGGEATAPTPPVETATPPADVQPATPPTAPVEQAPAQPTEPIPAPVDPAEVQANYDRWTQTETERMARDLYALSPEQAELMETEPAKVLPQLAARLHMEVLQQVSAVMMRVVPHIMHNVQQSQQVQSTREAEFFTEWPELKQHRQEVLQLGTAYAQANPTATFADFVRDVGAMVAVAKRIDLSSRVQAQPVPNGNGRAVTAPPPKPLAAQGGGAARRPAGSRNEFEALDEAFETADYN